MLRSRVVLIVALAAALAAGAVVRGQMPPVAGMKGEVGLGLLLRQLKTTAVLMQAVAHPDDENNGMLAAMGWGQGVRTVVVSATRGDGGQNEIGPELGDALATARTEELLSVHQFDSAEQYFTRAVDFGYSFSADETYEKWGRQEILGDYVRLIRTVRPDIVIAMRPDGQGGGQHHQASAVISREAFLAAGDPAKFPEQIREGLRPWRPKKFYYTGRFGFAGEPPPPSGAKLTAVDTAGYDPLLGESYAEIGSRARSYHKTQGMAQLLSLPGPSSAGYQLVESGIPGLKEKGDASLFDGIDTSVPGLARHVPGDAPAALVAGLAAIADAVAAAGDRATSSGPAAAVEPLVQGLQAVRALRSQLKPGALTIPDDARYEIDTRLERKERQFVDAILAAGGIRLEALADDGLVVAGQPVKLTVIAANRGASAIAVKDILFRGLDGEAGVCKPGAVAAAGVYRCEAALEVSKQARLTGQVLEAAAERRAVRVRSGRAVRPAVPADAIPRPVRSRGRRRADSRRARRAASLRGQHLQRREADGAARGAAPGGVADARDCDPPGRPPAVCRAPGGARGARDRDKRQHGAGAGRGHARGAGGLDGGAALRDRVARTPGRGRDGALHGDATARREAGRVQHQGRGGRRGRQVHERLPGGGVPAHAAAAPHP